MSSDGSFGTPIVLCVYNRPHLSQQVLASLRSVRPSHVLVVADGPKGDDPADRKKCSEVIALLEGAIDWPADIEWNVAPVNLGCRKRFQTGLTWAFGRVEEAIVLEDDCIPHPSFFRFCATLLERYRSDQRVALICGSSFQAEPVGTIEGSYYFSRYPLIWGWAGWRRTWKLYDSDIDAWETLRNTPWLFRLLADPVAVAYWRHIFDRVRDGFDTWDYSLTFSCWHAGALAVHPYQNLVGNIGFEDDATHTRDRTSIFANMPVHEMSFPLVHPDQVERNPACDELIERVVFSGTTRQRLLEGLRRARAERAT